MTIQESKVFMVKSILWSNQRCPSMSNWILSEQQYLTYRIWTEFVETCNNKSTSLQLNPQIPHQF